MVLPATTILFAVGIFGSSVFFSSLKAPTRNSKSCSASSMQLLGRAWLLGGSLKRQLHVNHWSIKPIGFHGMEYLCTFMLLKYMVNVGKIFHTMDPMGKKKTCSSIITLQILCDACRRKLQKLMLARNFSPPEANVSKDIGRSWRSWRVGLRKQKRSHENSDVSEKPSERDEETNDV